VTYEMWHANDDSQPDPARNNDLPETRKQVGCQHNGTITINGVPTSFSKICRHQTISRIHRTPNPMPKKHDGISQTAPKTRHTTYHQPPFAGNSLTNFSFVPPPGKCDAEMTKQTLRCCTLKIFSTCST